MERNFLTVAQIAKCLQMNESTICGWLRSSRLPGFKLSKEWRISLDDLASFLEEHANRPQVRTGINVSDLGRPGLSQMTRVAPMLEEAMPEEARLVNGNDSEDEARSALSTVQFNTSGQTKSAAKTTTLAKMKIDIREREATKPMWAPPWRLDDK